MKLLVLFLLFTIRISGQPLVFIPDSNLRRELNVQGFLRNDSLDVQKTQGRLILELDDKGIENLYGLQYFHQVWALSISGNRLKDLENLPPNLTRLACNNNQLTVIDSLPPNLEYFKCARNQIFDIKNLPEQLISLDLVLIQ